nr:hypothetical protein [Tanacetum cinerariifolium]
PRVPSLIGSPKFTYSTSISSTPMRSSATFHTGFLTREAVKEDEEEDEGNEVAEGGAGHEGAGGSTDMYHNMSQGYEADYPPVGYQGYMPSGYEYLPDPSQDDS